MKLRLSDRSHTRWRTSHEDVVLCLLLVVLVFIVLLPLPCLITTHVAGFGDVWQHLWNMWWFDQSVERGIDPYLTDVMYFPTGADLSFHSYSPLNMVFSYFLQKFLPLTIAYNILVIASLVLGTLTAYLLGRSLTVRPEGGFMCAIIWGFSSIHLSRIMFFHLFANQLMPLYLYFLFRWYRTGKRAPVIGAAAALALSAMVTWYQFLFLLIMTAVFILVFRRKGWFTHVIIGSVVTSILLVPFLYHPLLHVVHNDNAMVVPPGMAKTFSVELLSLIIPPENHPLWSEWVGHYYSISGMHHTERTNYLGWIALGLFCGMFLLTRETLSRSLAGEGGAIEKGKSISHDDGERPIPVDFLRIFLIILFLVGTILALGPVPQIAGKSWDMIRLPFSWLETLPIFNAIRSPNRFLFLSQLSLACAGAWIGTGLLSSVRRQPSWWTKGIRLAALSSLLLIDYWVFPSFPVSESSTVPEYFSSMGQSGNQDGIILDIPLPQQDFSKPLFYQTIHQQKIFGGYISRPPVEAEHFIEEHPFLEFARAARLSLSDSEALDARRLMESWPIRAIVVHQDVLPEQSRDLLDHWLRSWCGPPLTTTHDSHIFTIDKRNSMSIEKGLNDLVPPVSLPVWLFREKSCGQMIVHAHDGHLLREWVLWENGHVAQTFSLVQEISCQVRITAHGTAVDGQFPRILVTLDGNTVGQATIGERLEEFGPFIVSLSAGLHVLALDYENDRFQPPEDRNLFLFLATITTGEPPPENTVSSQ